MIRCNKIRKRSTHQELACACKAGFFWLLCCRGPSERAGCCCPSILV